MPTKNIVFIDSRVAGYQTLVNQLGADTEWYLLDENQDGIDQMQCILASYSGLDSVQVISHGSTGTLYLGSTVLNVDKLSAYQTQLDAIGSSLTETGDILLYGCSVAQGEVGLQFINTLALLTGADVAASTDATGSMALGGDSVLEASSGAVEVAPLNTEALVQTLGVNTAPTFIESDGKVITDFDLQGNSAYYGRSITVQDDGKILVAGYTYYGQYDKFAVVRYNEDGMLDNSFGDDGKLTTDVKEYFEDYGQSVAVQADGKILVVGYSSSAYFGFSEFAVVRYNTNGELDTSFSDDGRLTTGFWTSRGYSVSDVSATGVTMQSDGKILVAGVSGGNFALVRYNHDGLLDDSFGQSGSLVTDLGSSADSGKSVTVQPDGKILVAGTSNGDFALARYKSDGTLDTSFSGDGMLTTDFLSIDQGSSVIVQADGKIVVAGSSGGDFALARYNTDGSLDTSFDGDGKLTTDFATSVDTGNGVTLQSDGKIVVAGSSGGDFALVRYNTDGSLDTTFDSDGKLTTDFGAFLDSGNGVTLQADGKIVVAGSSGGDFALARYNINGSLDSTFSSLRHVTYTEGSSGVVGKPVALSPRIEVNDAELSALGHYAGATLTLARHGGANAEDMFSALAGGTLSSLIEGSFFSLDGSTIGRVTRNSGGSLALVFNTNATEARVNQALQQIAYSNTSDTPPASVQIDWTLNDGNTGGQGSGGALGVTSSSTVSITPANDAPVSTYYTLPAQTISNGERLNYSLPNNAFADPDGDTLTYGISMSDGSDVPPWLSIDPATGALTGTPDVWDVGTFSTRLWARDSGGLSASARLEITVNGRPTGDVLIAGEPVKNQPLTVTNTLVDPDGLGMLYYQWQADGVNITGATGSTFTPTPAEVGKSLTVIVTYTDAKGMVESVTSASSTVVTAGENMQPSFGMGNGKIITDLGAGAPFDTGYSVAVQADGKILVTGHSYSTNSNNADFALVRYNPDGKLDTSFGNDGKLTTDLGSPFDYGYSVSLQADGKILVAGVSGYNSYNRNFALARYNSDGTLDASFDGDGMLTTGFSSSNNAYGQSVTVQSDGKILVAGAVYNYSYYYGETKPDFALVRYNPDGTLDTSFSGAGMLTTDIGLSYDWGHSVTVQTDGKILVAGGSSYGNINGEFDFALMRYNPDGTLDNSFSSDGILTTDFGFSHDGGKSITVQVDGKILVAGVSSDAYGSDFALLRYNTDGTLDTSFSIDGMLTTDFGSHDDGGTSVTVQADGKILVAGSSSNGYYDFALARYNPDGTLDTSFSGDGMLTTDFGSSYDPTYDWGYSVTVQADGKILVAGNSYGSGPYNSNFALARYNPDGSLDLSFDMAGVLGGTVSYTEHAPAIVLDSDVQIEDPDLYAVNNYSGATLSLARHGGAQAEDRFSGAGIVAGQASGDVTIGSTTVGTYNWDAGTLTIAFNESATQALVNQTAQAIAYQNTNDAPVSSAQIDWTFSDGNTGTQGSGGELTATGSTTVNITPANDAPSGAVTISGTLQQGETLTASNTLTDPDGMGTVSYQWLANGVAITGAANKSLTLGQNQVGKTISVTASYTDGQGTAESVASEQTPEVVQAAHLAGMVYHWKNHALLDGVDIQISGADGDFKSHSVQGSFNFNELAADSYQLIVSWAAGHQGNAVTVSDALAALRIFQALNPNPDSDGMGPLPAPLLSPYQVMAADVDGDKKVTMADVEGILRMAVNAEGALVPEWRFVEETRDFWDEASALYTLTGASAGWAPEILTEVGPHGSQENLIAVLMGDVNGSWDAIAGAEYLEDAYFDELATMIGVPAWQWAV